MPRLRQSLGIMDERTQSEELFEEYCLKYAIPCHRIIECDSKSPDYEIELGDLRPIVEVKEITPNPEEREAKRKLNQNGFVFYDMTPGKRVRKKITDASPQIRSRSKGIHPSILVLFDEGQTTRHLDSYHILVAMYGFEQIHIEVPSDMQESPRQIGSTLGPSKKMTQTDNTSISAIGVIGVPSVEEITLQIYHNIFAAIPLPTDVLQDKCIAQYVVQKEDLANAGRWRRVN